MGPGPGRDQGVQVDHLSGLASPEAFVLSPNYRTIRNLKSTTTVVNGKERKVVRR